jgi:aminopeptidase N
MRGVCQRSSRGYRQRIGLRRQALELVLPGRAILFIPPFLTRCLTKRSPSSIFSSQDLRFPQFIRPAIVKEQHMRVHLEKILSIIALIVFWSAIATAQQSEVMREFYRQEQDNWREYIAEWKDRAISTNFDVTFYHLHIDLPLAAPSLTGDLLCRFRATEDSLTSIKLSLRREFGIDSIDGNVSSFLFQADTITIALDHPFMTNESGWVRVFYRGTPPVANGLKGLRYVTHATNQRVIASLSTPFLSNYWWPCKDGPGDKPDSVYVDITIPDTSIAGIPVVAVSNGTLAGVSTSAGKRTFQWRERYPIIPYYVMAAVSNYRDFHQTFSGTHGEQFPLDYYVFDEHLAAAQQGVADLPQAIQLFSDLFGTYPFQAEKYGMTQLGFYGAIENQTNTIINNMGTSYFTVSVHELSHMWFGDMITCRDWHHGWLNEGFASYAEALWAEHNGGFAAYKNYMQGFQFYNGGTLYLQNITDPFGIFVTIIYNKGACVLHMLRGVLGDSAFFASLAAYSANPAFRYGHATTEDFQNVCETVANRDLDFFFQQWVYDQYYPIYNYSFRQDTVGGLTRVVIQQTQATQGRRAVFEMPIRLKFTYVGGGDTTVTVWDNQQNQTFLLNLGPRITSMQFDPDGWILKTAQLVGVEKNTADELPRNIKLEQNYPNPFNPATTIRYELPATAHVRLSIATLLGEEVAVLVDGNQQAGSKSVEWNAGDKASGIYFCRLDVGGSVLVKKLLLLR